MRRCRLLGLLPCLLLSGHLTAEVPKLYIWKDHRGIPNYSQLPPPYQVDYLPLSPVSWTFPWRTALPKTPTPLLPGAKKPEDCDELMRDEFQYRHRLIEESYQFRRLQCELRDINQPTKVGLANCYAKQDSWRQKQFGKLHYLDACR